MRIITFLLLYVFTATANAEGQSLYKIYGPRGVITFSSRKPEGKVRYETLKPLAPRRSAMISISGHIPRPVKSQYDTLIKEVAVHHNVDASLVKAVVHAESSFNPFATSHKGAMGLMQLMPKTAHRFGVKNAYHPQQNLMGGTKYLKWLIARYDGNLRLALAAYNAGERVVDRLKAVPPYSETQGYVRKVLKFHEVYRCVEAGGTSCRT